MMVNGMSYDGNGEDSSLETYGAYGVQSRINCIERFRYSFKHLLMKHYES